MNTLKVALLGAGNVGSEVARILLEDSEVLASRAGSHLELIGIAVRDTESKRAEHIGHELLTTDAEALVDQADIVIELIGGIEPAGSLVARALRRGSVVVTGNKALLAERGAELFQLARDNSGHLGFEAAVAGAIPILRPINESLSGDRITKVMGIVNGTTNFILDAMDTTGADFGDVLKQAQDLGYAEADPTADIEGYDAAAKAAILAMLSFHADFRIGDVFREGITSITAEDVDAAKDAGFVIKLLAIAERLDNGVAMRVHPTLIPREHPLGAVHGAFNAVFVEADNAGELMFYGQGAGGRPTASAVMGDLVSAVRRLTRGIGAAKDADAAVEVNQSNIKALGIENVLTSYCIGLTVTDRPGVLSRIAAIFADNGVSIEQMRQTRGSAEDDQASILRIITHRGSEQALAKTVESIRELDVVSHVNSVLRVEGN
ncbi:homoserine dehydrogenase [Neomicrococcus lactis]|uniref:homoserine dehydrogenase n=1 Tax=Neomicrococcus lactis TaxID=732241 RepID=UPI002301BCD7|nr:homoserine dehydrogenase [Neomicrococcus lactis]